MIQVDLTHMRRFIALPYEAALAPRLRIAHNHLQKNDGAGGDFTGWVRLPQEYDRQEFDRIQAAARRIQSDSRALVVIGIGGSYLGARGVIECLCSPNYNLKRKNTPNIYFVGNGLSDRQLRETMELAGNYSLYAYEEELRDKTARLIFLDAELNLDANKGGQQEQVVAKAARPSVLDKLRSQPAPSRTDKKQKRHEEVR